MLQCGLLRSNFSFAMNLYPKILCYDEAVIKGNFGAGEGNRTLVGGLEGPSSTIELHPLKFEDYIIPPRGTFLLNCCSSIAGGGGWIRTIVGVSQQIYSLPPLATRAPLRRERMKLLLKDSKLSRVTDKNPAKRYQVAYHDGSTLINTLFNASF